MTDMERNALEREFEDKSGRLSEMMIQMSEMEKLYKKYEAAVRANAVMTFYEAVTREQEEASRMQKHVHKACKECEAAQASKEQTLIDAASEAWQAQKLAHSHALLQMENAQIRYVEELKNQGFDSEDAFKAAFLTKPAFMKLEETVNPFRMEYATLLARCEEIEALLSAEED